MQFRRTHVFKKQNIFDILEKIEEDQIKYGAPVKEEVNDIYSSSLKNLPTKQLGGSYDPNDPDKAERQEKEDEAGKKMVKLNQEREDRYNNSPYIQSLSAKRLLPPEQQDSLKGWVEPKGPGTSGYHVGKKKGWNDQPKVINLPGRGRVQLGFDDLDDVEEIFI